MNLDKLKKELKKHGPETQKNRRRKVLQFLLALLVCALLLAMGFGYRIYQKTVPGRLYSKGLTLESQDRPEQALKSYQRLFRGYSETPRAAEALFRAARICRYDLRQDQQALLLFLQLEHDYPESAYVLQAQQEAADLTKNRLRDFAHAIVIYQRLLDSGSGEGDRILYEIADCYFRLNNYSQARIELDALLERFPESPLRAEVLYRRASATLLEGLAEEARAGFGELIEQFPGTAYAAEAQFSLAELLEAEERLRDALKAYQGLTDYPKPELVQEKIDRLKARITKKKKVL